MFARRHSGFFSGLWLTLGIIFAHAVLPGGSAYARGSAFSATTAEVSLAPSRRNDAQKGKNQAGADASKTNLAGGASGDPAIAASAQPPRLLARALPPRLAIAAAEAPRLAPMRGFRARAPPSA